MHRAIRAFSLVFLVLGIAWYVWRGQRTPEQEELTVYVEKAVPRLHSTEDRIDAELAQLTRAPGLAAAPARALLVDTIIPELIALRAQAQERTWQTGTVKQLVASYDACVLAQIEACRTAVRVIDDAKLDTKTAAAKVREAFVEASRKRAAWKAQLTEACRANQLHTELELPRPGAR